MLKLKKNVREFLKANVKPEYFLDMVERIEGYKKFSEGAVRWLIHEHQSKSGVAVSFLLCSSNLEEIEDLKPYKWYPRERWNGNPKDYWIVKRSTCYEVADTEIDTTPIHQLEEGWNYFMYIEPLEAEDDAS